MFSFPVWLSVSLSSLHLWFISAVMLLSSWIPSWVEKSLTPRLLYLTLLFAGLFCGFFLHVFVFLWFQKSLVLKKKKNTKWAHNSLEKGGDVCYYEVDPKAVVNYNFFLINKPLWFYWPAPVKGMVRDQLDCVSVLQVVSTCLLFSACHETDELQWNPTFISVWPDSAYHANTGVELEMRRMYHWSIDEYSIWSFYLPLSF